MKLIFLLKKLTLFFTIGCLLLTIPKIKTVDDFNIQENDPFNESYSKDSLIAADDQFFEKQYQVGDLEQFIPEKYTDDTLTHEEDQTSGQLLVSSDDVLMDNGNTETHLVQNAVADDINEDFLSTPEAVIHNVDAQTEIDDIDQEEQGYQDNDDSDEFLVIKLGLGESFELPELSKDTTYFIEESSCQHCLEKQIDEDGIRKYYINISADPLVNEFMLFKRIGPDKKPIDIIPFAKILIESKEDVEFQNADQSVKILWKELEEAQNRCMQTIVDAFNILKKDTATLVLKHTSLPVNVDPQALVHDPMHIEINEARTLAKGSSISVHSTDSSVVEPHIDDHKGKSSLSVLAKKSGISHIQYNLDGEEHVQPIAVI